MRKDIRELQRLLLSVGGDRFQRESFLNEAITPQTCGVLLNAGAFFPGKARPQRGRSNGCHENSEQLARTNGLWREMFGLALSEDGCWRVHGWVQTPNGIIETTERRTQYFGIPCAGKSIASKGGDGQLQ